MKPSSRHAFTLLELLVVLAILAIVTALAVRSLDGVESQRRYETAQRGLEELESAVIGSPDDRAADGSRTISGFVADMGRLPRTNLSANAPELELRELWENPGTAFAFDVRPAIVANGVAPADADAQVLVPGGWRGPYLRLPLGTTTLLDGWGYPVTSPVDASPPNPDATGYARLRGANDQPITAAGHDVEIVRILGANGRRDGADTRYDRDEAISFTGDPATATDDRFRASLAVQVEVLKANGDTADPMDFQNREVTVRVFGPSPANAAQIAVAVSDPVPFGANPVTVSIPFDKGVTIGPRIARAYLHPAGSPATSAADRRSTVKHVTLRSGPNLLALAIDR